MTIVDTSKQIYSYEEMCADLQELENVYTGKIQVNVLAVTADRRNIYEVVAGNPDADRHIIIQAGIHAREYMTSLLVMKQLEFYLAYGSEGTYKGKTAGEWFDQAAVHLMPMMNPDGISISQYGLDGIRDTAIRENIQEWYNRDQTEGLTSYSMADYLKYWKANANGVDLNRNFDYGFEEYKGAAQPGAQKYKGTAPASETESAALVKRTEELNPVLAISYHATGSVIYWDYGQSGSLRDDCRRLVEVIHSVNGNEIKYAATDKQDAAGYGDWLVMKKGIPSATIEIGAGAAPLAAREFEDIWKRNALMWAALAEYALEQ